MSDNQPSVRDAKPLFALLLGLILFLFGIAIGYMVGGKTSAAPGGRGYDEGYAAARSELQSKLEASGLSLPEEQLAELESQPVYSLSGAVLDVSNDAVRIRATFPSFDILSEPQVVEVTARVTDDTRIVRRKELTPEEFDEVFREFNEQQQSLFDRQARDAESVSPEELSVLTPPEPFVSEEIAFSELEPGMVVSVTSFTDIRGAESFDAAEIYFSEPL